MLIRFSPRQKQTKLIEPMCSLLRHSLNTSIHTLLCLRKRKVPAFGTHRGFCPCEEKTVLPTCLFVRFCTSLLMSSQIKMTIQSEGSEAQFPHPYLFHFTSMENTVWAENLCVGLSEHVHAYTCKHGSHRPVNLKWFGEFTWGLNVHNSSDWLSNQAFPLS